MTKYKKAILLHGCFWHGHNCKKGARPTSNTEFWNTKIQKNIEHDKKVEVDLKQLGWDVIIIWNCGLKNKADFEVTMNKVQARIISS